MGKGPPPVVEGQAGAQIATQAGREGAVGGIDTGGTGNFGYLRNAENCSNSFEWHFKKTWKLYGHAWSRSILTEGTGDATRVYMTTGMMAIPIDYPFMYLSTAEWNLLGAESYVTNCKQTVRLINARTSFQANSSDVQTATQGNQLFINYAKGIERDQHVGVCFNYGQTSQPAKVTSTKAIADSDADTVIDKLWGKANFTDTYPPGLCGTWQEWDWYLQYCVNSWDNLPTGYWNIDATYDSFNAVTNYNTIIGSNEWDFGATLLKTHGNLVLEGGHLAMLLF
jgi:hypothetical protein